MSDELPPVPPELAAEIERVADEVRDDAEALRKVEYLIDALIMRGQLPESFRRVLAKIHADRAPTVLLASVPDKYTVVSPDIPCAELIPLCGARCCGLAVTLSEQDVRERVLPFVLEKPYMLPRDPETKRCACMEADGKCAVYDHRPATCRLYDCRKDRRVWLDYEKRIPAPMPEKLDPDRF